MYINELRIFLKSLVRSNFEHGNVNWRLVNLYRLYCIDNNQPECKIWLGLGKKINQQKNFFEVWKRLNYVMGYRGSFGLLTLTSDTSSPVSKNERRGAISRISTYLYSRHSRKMSRPLFLSILSCVSSSWHLLREHLGHRKCWSSTCPHLSYRSSEKVGWTHFLKHTAKY